jgi:uncharacterized protein YfaS (alpha-2-macroglobulin family)
MRWLLADAYLLRGMDDAARSILSQTGTETSDYSEFGPTYGSAIRDMAMILESTVLFGRWAEAQRLFQEISLHLSSENWFSTQSTGYALLAMGKFIRANVVGTSAPRLSGAIGLPDGTTVRFDTDELRVAVPVERGYGGTARVTLDRVSNLERAFVTLDWQGIPLRSSSRPVARNLSVAVSWYDDDGRPLNPGRVTQGSSFWGLIRVGKSVNRDLNELALVQILPSGWEIENLRLSGEGLPDFLAGRSINQAEYTDIRDDRMMWFFDLGRYEQSREFALKVNAVTVGEFFLPQTTFEAMYDDAFYASRPGREVEVRAR